MSDQNEPSPPAEAAKKPGLGAQIVGWILILAIIGGVWQCVTGKGASGSSSNASSSTTTDQTASQIRNSPAAHVSNYAEACNFVVSMRAKGVDMQGVRTANELLRAAGVTEAANLIDKANRDIGD